MVKANELRIGNWIFDRTFSDFGNPSLKAIQVDANLIKTIDLEGGKYHRNIALTPEILEQCGFETNDNKVGFSIGLPIGNGTDLFVELELTESMSCGINSFPKNYNYLKDIKYLHQLQNLYFALTGEELVYQPIKELT